MLAFHGRQEIKEFYLQRVREHALADEIIQGEYWKNGRGCGIGCTIHSGKHYSYKSELGLPVWLARLEEQLFEVQLLTDAKAFPLRFLQAIPVGANVEAVKPRILLALLIDPQLGVSQYCAAGSRLAKVVGEVEQLLKRIINGGVIPDDEWYNARIEAHNAIFDTKVYTPAVTAARVAKYAVDVAIGDADYLHKVISSASDATISYAPIFYTSNNIDIATRVDTMFAIYNASHYKTKSAICYKVIAEKLLELLSQAPVGVEYSRALTMKNLPLKKY